MAREPNAEEIMSLMCSGRMPLIMLQIKALIARDLYDMAEYFQVINDDNESFQEALRLINDEQRYKKELGR